MGRVSAPFGVTGWIRVQPFTESLEGLLAYRAWWVGGGARWKRYQVTNARVQGEAVIAQLAGCEDRDAAAALRGQEVAVSREELPQPAANEWYWSDLIGLRVINLAGEDLGVIARMLRTGANDVLVVEAERERLVPFIAGVVKEVDLAAGVMRVDWSAEY
jgi:16S rRNA processing protein RimM